MQLSSVRISRDDKGVKPGWLLDRVNIDVDEKDEHYVFYCNRWLGSSDAAVSFTPGKCGEWMFCKCFRVGMKFKESCTSFVRDRSVRPEHAHGREGMYVDIVSLILSELFVLVSV